MRAPTAATALLRTSGFTQVCDRVRVGTVTEQQLDHVSVAMHCSSV